MISGFFNQKVLEENGFKFTHTSPLKRKGINNSNWIKKDQHNIKLHS